MRDISSDSMARTLVNSYIARHGVPEMLLTDRGANLTSTTLKKTCELLGIKKIQTTVYRLSVYIRV